MRIFPSSTRILAILRVATIIGILWFGVQVATGLVGVHYSAYSGWKTGNYVAGNLEKNILFSDAQGNTILATGESVSDTQFLAVHGFGNDLAVRVVAIVVPLLWLSILIALHHILRIVRSGDPFVDAATRRLRVIAGCLMLIPLAAFAVNILNDHIYNAVVPASTRGVMPTPIPSNVATSFGPGSAAWHSIPVWVWGAAFVVLAIAEVFAAGVRNRRDMEGLV